ncbi:CPBP family intramembrane metalloprotease [Persicimonas caeni]|uniref:CPBP family intramembrane metalloprotease n=1 Tax=Persicimonas caeni TaxID=2292766 RepID=A0A4Y6PXM2_PERCE|nr:CPBP family intramembrane metalloprotease [Persicimonas caeni]QED34202.1 CPBP family intramembrane metalloprotease [Persicimonas caeni]
MFTAFSFSACAIPTQSARLEPTAPPTEVEASADTRYKDRACSPYWSWLYPGLGQLCVGKTGEGATLAALGAAEIGSAIAFETGVPLLAFQNVWVYGIADAYIEVDRAEGALYAPQDTLGELVAAPFNWEVMKEPYVWGGILAMSAAAFGYSYLLGSTSDATPTTTDDTPRFLGREMRPEWAYSLAAGTGVVLFEHVAIGEEALFRGVIQSSLARNFGEMKGWAWGSVIFGAVHILNASALPPEQREAYMFYSVPFITAVGSYLGASYMWSDYSLAAPVALHFWYDFILSAAQYAVSPSSSPIGASVTIPF